VKEVVDGAKGSVSIKGKGNQTISVDGNDCGHCEVDLQLGY
jgi:hypothetical protein